MTATSSETRARAIVSDMLAFCSVTVCNQRRETVGHFRGTVDRTRRRHRAADATPGPTAT
ncbi:MAG: hypothetical protein ABIW79_05380 [Gemmatimonas sp.]